MHGILGIKTNQTQKFLTDGTRIPVTLISVQDNIVAQVKTQENDAYVAMQLGIGQKKNPKKALVGHMKKANQDQAPLFLREIKIKTDATDDTLPKQGEFLQASRVFALGDMVKVTGVSKGKGFAGGVKRHGFRGGPRTHGQSDRERAPGSIGQTTTPGRVYKGKRMAGRMGTERVAVTNLVVVGVDEKEKMLLVKGLIPGNIGGMVVVEKMGKVAEKKFVPLHTEKTDEAQVEAAPVEEAKTDEPKEEVKTEAVVEEQKNEDAASNPVDAKEDKQDAR